MSFKRAPPGTALGSRGSSILQRDVPIPGTRRWVDGSLLVSTGHTQLDAYLGGGLPVGTTVLIEEDARNLHAPSMVRQFIAEGIAVDQRVVLAGLAPDDALRALLRSTPLNVSRGSKDTIALETLGTAAAVSRPDDAEADAPEAAAPTWDSQGSKLSIAWQYKKYLAPSEQQGAVGSGSAKFGHTYDLNRSIPPPVLAAARVRIVSAAAAGAADPWGAELDEVRAGDAAAAALLGGVAAALDQEEEEEGGVAGGGAGGVTRVVLEGLLGPTWPGYSGPAPGGVPFAGGVALTEPQLRLQAPALLLVARLRRLVQQHRAAAAAAAAAATSAPGTAAPARGRGGGGCGGAVLLASVPTHLLPPGVAARLRNAFDCVVKLHAFDDPPEAAGVGPAAAAGGGGGGEGPAAASTGSAPEFADYTGLLLLRRVPSRGSVAGLAPAAAAAAAGGRTFAFRHDRRRLAIDVPHMPPELAAPPAPAPAAPGPAGGGAAAVRHAGGGGAPGGLSCAARGAPGGVLDF